MKNLSLPLIAAIVWLGVGCSGGNDQVITGRIAPGFPSKVTSVRVVSGGTVIATDQVAPDGSFQLAFPPAKSLAFEVVGAGRSGVVFPRQAGTAVALHTTFSARAGGAPFDLGQIRYVGSASSTTIVFHNGPSSQTECEDGHDANGATCIDDDDDEDDGTCEAEDDDGESDDDSATPPAPSSDPALSYEGDAVAEHNFPADGCHDDDDDDDGADDSADD